MPGLGHVSSPEWLRALSKLQEGVNEMTVRFRQPDIDESLIFTMRELSPHDIDEGEEKLYKASKPVTVIDHQEIGLFDWYVVVSGDNHVHQVWRLGWFVKCDCGDFTYSKTACKHVVRCIPQVCRKCFKTEVPQPGAKCDRCKEEIYLPPTSTKPVEKIGSIRI
jgi:hypothetical protein